MSNYKVSLMQTARWDWVTAMWTNLSYCSAWSLPLEVEISIQQRRVSASTSFGSSGATVYVSLKVHQIYKTELNTCAAGIWHHWFWHCAGATAVNVVPKGFEEGEVGGPACAGDSPWSSPEAAAPQQSHWLPYKHLSLNGLESFSNFTFWKIMITLSFFPLSLIGATLCCSPYLSFLQPLLCIHAVMHLWEFFYASHYSLASYGGCCVDVTRVVDSLVGLLAME